MIYGIVLENISMNNANKRKFNRKIREDSCGLADKVLDLAYEKIHTVSLIL